MTRVAEFLMKNYYGRYRGTRPDIVPTDEQIDNAIKNHAEKFVVIEDKEIKGVGVFLTLSDETFSKLHELDISKTEVITELIPEHGPNVHFILLSADGIKTILTGLRMVVDRLNPKTVSWWNPEFKKLHIYKIS